MKYTCITCTYTSTPTTTKNNLTTANQTSFYHFARLQHRLWTIYLICNHAAVWFVGWCWLMMIMLTAHTKSVEDMWNTFNLKGQQRFGFKKRGKRSIGKFPLSTELSWQTLIDLVPSKIPSLNQSRRESLFTDLPIPSLKKAAPTQKSRLQGEFSLLEKVFLSGNLSIFRELYCYRCLLLVILNNFAVTYTSTLPDSNRHVFIGLYREQQPPNLSSAMGPTNILPFVQVSCKNPHKSIKYIIHDI